MAGLCRSEARGGETDTADHERDAQSEAWTDGRSAEDDEHVERDHELAVALADVTEGPARATVLNVTQTEPSHGFVAWQALVDGYAPRSSNDPAIELQQILDAQEVQRCKGVEGKAH